MKKKHEQNIQKKLSIQKYSPKSNFAFFISSSEEICLSNSFAKNSHSISSSVFSLDKMTLMTELDEVTEVSSSSSSGIVQELTLEALLKLALLEEPEEAELTLETVDIVDIGDMVVDRPERELRPLSL